MRRSASLPADSLSESRKAQPPDFATRFERLAGTGSLLKKARAVAAIADDLTAGEVNAALDRMALIGTFGSAVDRDQIVARLFARLGELNPEAALQRALSFPGQRVLSIAAVLRGWAGKDSVAAEAWLAEFHSPLQDAARRGLIAAVAKTDPARAFTLLQGLYDYNDRGLAEAVFRGWTESSPTEAAAHAAQLPAGYFREQALKLVASEWAQADGASAVAWADTVSGSVVTPALKIWMDRDPAAAMEWLEQIPDEKKRNEQLGSLVSAIAEDDLGSAAHFLATMLPPGKEQDRALEDLTSRWVQQDPRGALLWAQQADAGARAVVVPQLALYLAAYVNLNPQDAPAALELAQSLSGRAQIAATANLLGAWALREPAAAAAWAARFPGEYEYFSAVAQRWAATDPKSAQNWIDALGDGPFKDQVLDDSVNNIARTAPEVAARWVEQIGDAQKRDAAFQRVAKQWLDSDPKAARNWIATLPLSPAAKDALLKNDAR